MEQEHVDRVEAYFRNEMSEQEASQFLADLEGNTALRQLYDEYRLAMEAVDLQTGEELKQQFDAWQSEAEAPSGKQRGLFPGIWKVAASLALLVSTLYIVFYSSNQTTTLYQLSMDYYVAPESPGKTMGSADEAWSLGLEAYERKDFTAAAVRWGAIENPSPEQQYYLAHAYFQTQNYPKAATLFRALAGGNSIFNQSAQWFLALTYLATSEKNSFNEVVLMMVDDPEHTFHREAKVLYKKALKIQSDTDE